MINQVKLCMAAVAFLLLNFNSLNAQNNTFTDDRDGRSYNTVEIDGKIWMAENMVFDVPKSSFYQNDSARYAMYGRLYTWDAAIAACPDGWRLPTIKDYENLISFYGGQDEAGEELKSNTAHWREVSASGSTAFKALPAGGMIHFGWYFYVKEKAHFWTSTEMTENRAEAIELDYRFDKVFGAYGYDKRAGFSVRYIKE